MGYNDFVIELIQRLLDEPEMGLQEQNIKYLEDGYEPDPEDKAMTDEVINLNMRFNNVESNTLVGSFLLVSAGTSEHVVNTEGRFFVPDLYEQYKKKGWEFVMGVIKDAVNYARVIKDSGVIESISNYEAVKDRIIIRPLNYAANSAALEKSVYQRIEDFVLCLYVLFSDDGDTVNTAKVTNEIFSAWGKDRDEVWELALKNTQSYAPPRMTTMRLISMDPVSGLQAKVADFMREDYKLPKLMFNAGYVLTTARQINGAVALFYPGVQERLAELFGGSYYIAFTSVHEAQLHAYGTVKPSQVKDCLMDTLNAFPAEDILTRRVFFYDAKRKCLKVKA